MLCSFPPNSIHANRFYGENKIYSLINQFSVDHVKFNHLQINRIRDTSVSAASAQSKLARPLHAIS
jgi:hypothetical protein